MGKGILMDEDQEIEQQELQKKKKHRKIVNGILIAVLILKIGRAHV